MLPVEFTPQSFLAGDLDLFFGYCAMIHTLHYLHAEVFIQELLPKSGWRSSYTCSH